MCSPDSMTPCSQSALFALTGAWLPITKARRRSETPRAIRPRRRRFTNGEAGLDQPDVAESLALRIHRVKEAVRVEVQPDPGRQADAPFTVRLSRQSDREPRAFQEHRGPAGGEVERTRIARRNVAKVPGRHVQHPVQQGRELLGRRVIGEESLQAVCDLGRRRDVGRVAAGPVSDQD